MIFLFTFQFDYITLFYLLAIWLTHHYSKYLYDWVPAMFHIFFSLHIFSILVPDHYAELDRSCEVIVQSIAICMTPVYNCKTAIVSIMLLTCMSYCCELSAAMLPKFFTDVLTILDFRREIHPNETAAIAVLE